MNLETVDTVKSGFIFLYEIWSGLWRKFVLYRIKDTSKGLNFAELILFCLAARHFITIEAFTLKKTVFNKIMEMKKLFFSLMKFSNKIINRRGFPIGRIVHEVKIIKKAPNRLWAFGIFHRREMLRSWMETFFSFCFISLVISQYFLSKSSSFTVNVVLLCSKEIGNKITCFVCVYSDLWAANKKTILYNKSI